MFSPDFDGGKVNGRNGFPVRLQESLPGCPMLSFRDGSDAVFPEDISDRGVSDI